jgi:D-glycero-D-manno-heptose 1,7-bisphosphate phosphatase
LGDDRRAVTAAAFVDRDGVLNGLVADPVSGAPESPLRTEDVALLPHAAAGVACLRAAGYAIVVVSNQPAAAKGTITLAQLEAVNDRVLWLMADAGEPVDAVRLCLHHPLGVVPGLAGPCDCRKPAPGMLLDAARELGLDLGRSWMIGDTDADIAAGLSAGCGTVLIEHAPSAHKRTGTATPDLRASDLLDAARQLLVAPVR